MIKKQLKRTEPPRYKGESLITNTNINAKLKQILSNQQFYQVQLAEVRKIMTKQDIDEQFYPVHQYGAVGARLLYNSMQEEQLLYVIPRDPSIVTIPTVGEILLVSKHPSHQLDVSEGMIFDQYYYIGVLNILNGQNNNAIPDVSFISEEQYQAQKDQLKCGQDFYINPDVKKINYKVGDMIISGRYGHSIKFTNNEGSQPKNMLPEVIISNQNSKCFSQDKPQSVDLCGSSIFLSKLEKQPDNMPALASDRSLLDAVSTFSLIGNNILGFSDRIVLNARTNDVQVYSKKNIEISAKNSVFMQAKQISMSAKKVVIKVGSNQVTIDSAGVTIKSSNIALNGPTTIQGIQAGSTPGFCSLPVCAFTGAPHTINVVGS